MKLIFSMVARYAAETKNPRFRFVWNFTAAGYEDAKGESLLDLPGSRFE